MNVISVPLPDEDFRLFHEWTQSRGTSVEAFLAKQVRIICESCQMPLHPHVLAATGIFPADINAREAYLDAMEEKHR